MDATKRFDAHGIQFLFLVSFVVVCCKASSTYWSAAIQVIAECGFSLLTLAVTAWYAAKPAVIGFSLSFITWQMVLLNSNVPGIDPPTPFTPTKLRAKNSPRFHVDYIFAVIIGLMTTFSLVVRDMVY